MLYTWSTESFNKKKLELADTTILIRLCSLLSDDFAATKLLLVSMSSSWKIYWCPYSRVGHQSDSCLRAFCNYKLLQSFDNQFFLRTWFQISQSVQCWRWNIVHILLFTFIWQWNNALLLLLTRLTIFHRCHLNALHQVIHSGRKISNFRRSVTAW